MCIRPSDMTTARANNMITGTSVTVTGGMNCLGQINATFVTEKQPDGFFLVTKFPKHVDAVAARAILFLRRHGPLLVAGHSVWCDNPRQKLKGVTLRHIERAVDLRMARMVNGRTEMTYRGECIFRQHEDLVFSVPFDMVDEARRLMDDLYDRHHE